QEGGHFSTSLGEAENIVDKEQYVFTLFITEILRNCQTTQGHTQTRARRFIHLTKNHRQLIEHACFLHFMVQVIALTGTLTYASKNAIPTVAFGDIVDQFLNDHSLTNTSATEGTNFTTFHKGADQVDDFDTSLENLNL